MAPSTRYASDAPADPQSATGRLPRIPAQRTDTSPARSTPPSEPAEDGCAALPDQSTPAQNPQATAGTPASTPPSPPGPTSARPTSTDPHAAYHVQRPI